jgi:dicarboxylate transporter 10
MLKALHTFAVRDGKWDPSLRLLHSDFIGIKSLWSGLSASILRQTTYSTARFALYDILARNLQRRNGGKLSAGSTVACAGLAGGLAGMIGNPTEVFLLSLAAISGLT